MALLNISIKLVSWGIHGNIVYYEIAATKPKYFQTQKFSVPHSDIFIISKNAPTLNAGDARNFYWNKPIT